MKVNIMTSAKGGVGKTFLIFLKFLDYYKKDDNKKYVFIDLNFINKDLYNIFLSLYNISLDKMDTKKVSDTRFNYFPLKKDKIWFIWNHEDYYFPEGIVDLISQLAKIATSPEIVNWANDPDIEIFVDTNLHLKNFFSDNPQIKTKIAKTLGSISNLQLRFFFIWSFALFLPQRTQERSTIYDVISLFSDVFKNEVNWEKNALLPKDEQALLESKDERSWPTVGQQMVWSIDNLYHIFNYYIPFDEAEPISLITHRKLNFKPLKKFLSLEKDPIKGVSFAMMNALIEDKFKKISPEESDLNDIKIRIIEDLFKRFLVKGKRPKNILIIPTFDARLTGFTEKLGELFNTTGEQQNIDERYNKFYNELDYIIHELTL
jgi:hypothetical protein